MTTKTPTPLPTCELTTKIIQTVLDAVGSEHGREDSVARFGLSVEQPVRIEDEPAKVCLLKHGFDALAVSALRQPDAARITSETAPVERLRSQDLGAHRRRMIQQRQQRMRGGAGDDLSGARHPL